MSRAFVRTSKRVSVKKKEGRREKPDSGRGRLASCLRLARESQALVLVAAAAAAAGAGARTRLPRESSGGRERGADDADREESASALSRTSLVAGADCLPPSLPLSPTRVSGGSASESRGKAREREISPSVSLSRAFALSVYVEHLSQTRLGVRVSVCAHHAFCISSSLPFPQSLPSISLSQ